MAVLLARAMDLARSHKIRVHMTPQLRVAIVVVSEISVPPMKEDIEMISDEG